MKKKAKITIFLLALIVYSGSIKADGNSVVKTRNWYAPSHLTVQYAGEIGFLSVGTGYTYSNTKLQTSLLYGFVDEKHGGELINMLTLKQYYSPWNLYIPYKGMELKPLILNLGFTYHFGDEYNKYYTNQYEKGYYWFMKGIRTSGSIGTELYVPLNNKKHGVFESISVYYELVTTDLSIYSYISNLEHSEFRNIFSSALGTKFNF